MMPNAARADDPNDPTMRSAKARARDRALTRQLNLEELARVRQRDAREARERAGARGRDYYTAQDYAARSRDHARAMASYADDRARYERNVPAWRRAVAACRAGDYSACD